MSPIGVGAQKHDPDLPAGWVRTKFSEIYELAYGKSLTKNTRNPGGKYPVFGSNGVVGYHDAFLVEGPTIVVGRKGAAGAVSFSTKPCWPIDTTYYVRDGGHIDVQFSFYLITSLRLNQLDRSTAIPGLNRDDAYHLVIRLPPLPEQHRIVAKIEQLFSELDKGIESLKIARAQLATYRQAVLKHAFEGKLTAQWREENKDKLEKPEQLLVRIELERAARYERQLQEWMTAVKEWEGGDKRYRRPNRLKPSKSMGQVDSSKIEQLPPLPDSWHWRPFSWLLSIEKKSMTTGPFGTMLKKHEHQEVGVPVLGIENIGEGRFIKGNKIFVSEKKAAALSSFEVEPGELIISRSGTVGEICTVPEGLGKTLISTNLLRVALDHGVILSPFFVFMFQGVGTVRKQVKALCKGSSRDFLNQSILRSLVFPICSLQEQIQIIREIDKKLSLSDQLLRGIDSIMVKSNSLRQSILKMAFSGRLVEQDSSDESASVLLERIKAARAEREMANGIKRNTTTGKDAA